MSFLYDFCLTFVITNIEMFFIFVVRLMSTIIMVPKKVLLFIRNQKNKIRYECKKS